MLWQWVGGEFEEERLVWLLKQGMGYGALGINIEMHLRKNGRWRNTKNTTDVRNAFRFRLSLLCITYPSSKHS